MAYIRKRLDTGKYVIGFRDQYGVWRERTAGPRKKDAGVLLRRVLEEVAKGTFGAEKKDVIFAKFARQFLGFKKTELKASTYEDYKQVIRNHLLPFFGRVHLSQITPKKVQDFLQHMQSKGVTPATTGKVYRVLKAILRRAIAMELLDRDPTVAIRPPRVEREEMDYLTKDEVEALLEASQGDIHDIIATAVFSGLRQGEILALRWQDIDFQAGVIRVVRSYRRPHGFTDLKTSAARRAVPMPPHLIAILEDRYEAQGRPSPDDLVFPSAAGTPLDRNNLVARDFEPTLERAGIRRIRFHDLRHTYASLAIAAGMDPKALQQVIGHSSITVTMDIYAHLFPGSHDRALRRMAGMFSGDSRVIHLTRRGEETD